MSVVIETTLGDITVDLYLEQRPVTCLNFIKLCKMKYYNFSLFHSIRSGFIAQTGDPTGSGSGGQSIFGILGGTEKRFFSGEKMPKIRHTDTGLLSMVCTDDMMVGSQFFFTLAPDLDSLDGVHCVIGEITEGHEVLRKLNDVICDDTHRPYRDVRITHTVILEDPFNDPAGLSAPSRSPSPSTERLCGGRIAPDEEIDETIGKSAAEVHEMLEEKEAKARATILEIIGDLPDADIAPPENVLFVCKLNPVTTDEDLEIIFSRFGKIVSCEVIRDKKTGDSLQYAFIEFADKKSCEDAYFKMDNVLIDDRRIHVDFSQSVSKIRWLGKGRGVKHIGDEDLQSNNEYSKQRQKNYANGKGQDSNRINDKDEKKDYNRRHRHQDMVSKNDRNKRTTHKRDRSRSKSRVDKPRRELANDKHYSHRSSHHYEKVPESQHSSYKRKENSKSVSMKNKYSETKYGMVIKQSENHSIDNKRNNERKRNSDERRNNRSRRETDRGNNMKNLKYSIDETVPKHNDKQKYIHVEPRTPSPILEKTDKPSKNNETMKNKRNKKKRDPSTSSSDSESSESSSSSSNESTSSIDNNKKRKLLKTRKRKHSSSTTSSSSDSSSSSTTSSSSSSSSTSSDSNINKRRRHKENTSKKEANKPKKKM